MNTGIMLNKSIQRFSNSGSQAEASNPSPGRLSLKFLHDIELSTLAREIEAVKCCEYMEEKNFPSDDPVQKCPEDMSAEDSEQKNDRDIHDLPTRDTKDQSSSAPHVVSEDPSVQ